MDIMTDFMNYVSSIDIALDVIIRRSLRVLVILIIAFFVRSLARRLIKGFVSRLEKREMASAEHPEEVEKRLGTVSGLLRKAVGIVVWVTALMMILREAGINIGPILASAGIVGLAVGFGAQNLVRDVISGFFFILENQIRVGDVAIVNGTGGLVEEVNFRTIVLRDLSGTVHVFPNGSVSTLSNMTRDWSAYVFDIGVAYKEETDRVIGILRQVADDLRNDPEYGPQILESPEIFGVDKLDDSAVVIKGRIKTKPIQQWYVGREFLRRVKIAFDAQDVEIPFPHQTLYFGEASKPFDVTIMERLQSS